MVRKDMKIEKGSWELKLYLLVIISNVLFVIDKGFHCVILYNFMY
jgi:hypothetical protein